MTSTRLVELRQLEGRAVSVALCGGRRIDAASLVSAGRGDTTTVWLFVDGADQFVPSSEIVDFFESRQPRAS